jgi:Uma2 family endonuclease
MKTSITSFDQLDLSRHYTYQDYLTWKFTERVELLLGKVFKMSPAPNVEHQLISGRLFRNIANYLEGSKYLVFSAPFDVRLQVSKDEQHNDTVVQPDIVVVCDLGKLDEQGCNGAPDIVIEILSPGNSRSEMKDKFELYEASMVKEYWIVDPTHKNIIIYSLNNKNRYIGTKPFVDGEVAVTRVLQDIQLSLGDVFK